MRLNQSADAVTEYRDESPGIPIRCNRFLRQKAHLQICQDHFRFGGPQIDADDARPASIEMNQGGFPAAGQIPGGTRGDPAFRNQLLSNRGHGAALQASATGDFRARNGLMFANEVEDHPSVYVAGCSRRCRLEIVQINLVHKAYRTRPPKGSPRYWWGTDERCRSGSEW